MKWVNRFSNALLACLPTACIILSSSFVFASNGSGAGGFSAFVPLIYMSLIFFSSQYRS